MAYSKRKITVGESYSPGKSALQGLMTGYLSSSQTRQKSQRELEKSMIPKMMEIQARYNLQGMKSENKKQDDKKIKIEKKADKLKNELSKIKSHYQSQRMSLKTKIATSKMEDETEEARKENPLKVPARLQLSNLLKQLDKEEESETKPIQDKLDTLKELYGLE